MWWLGGIGVSMVLTLIFSLSNKSSDDASVRKEMHDVVQAFPNYSGNASYYDALVDRCHHDAFEAAYTMSGRRTRAKLDVGVYLAQISDRMARTASAEGHADIADTLRSFHDRIH